jgi:hypothetical protein
MDINEKYSKGMYICVTIAGEMRSSDAHLEDSVSSQCMVSWTGVRRSLLSQMQRTTRESPKLALMK